MKILVFIFCLLKTHELNAQKLKNEIFVFQSIIAGDTAYNTFEKQVDLIKSVGFDGIELYELDNFNDKLSVIHKKNFKASFLYVKVDLDQPALDSRLIGAIAKLKGSGTIICPYIIKKNSISSIPNRETDQFAVKMLRKLAHEADRSGLQVAIYPHIYFYVEKTAHAFQIAKKVNRKNLGLTFNLCHWLASSNETARKELKNELKQLSPYLKMISINGANNVVSKKSNIWEDYILPLDEGSFDVKELVSYVAVDLGLTIPIGIQCFGLKGDTQLVKRTFAKVNDMMSY